MDAGALLETGSPRRHSQAPAVFLVLASLLSCLLQPVAIQASGLHPPRSTCVRFSRGHRIDGGDPPEETNSTALLFPDAAGRGSTGDRSIAIRCSENACHGNGSADCDTHHSRVAPFFKRSRKTGLLG